jgi:hypothetical protein
MREGDPERKRIAGGNMLIWEARDLLVGVDELHVGVFACRPLQADVKIHDLKLVLDERSANFAILATPFDVGKLDAVALDQEAGAAVGERIDQRCRASGRIVVELHARPVKVACVEEAGQAVVGAIE